MSGFPSLSSALSDEFVLNLWRRQVITKRTRNTTKRMANIMVKARRIFSVESSSSEEEEEEEE